MAQIACFEWKAEFVVDAHGRDFLGFNALDMNIIGAFRVLNGVPFGDEKIAVPAAPRLLRITNKDA